MYEELNELSTALHHGVVNVVFTKKNGEERHMRCTQKLNMVPEDHHPSGGHKSADSVFAVWDFDKEGWRSFRKDSVISWSAE